MAVRHAYVEAPDLDAIVRAVVGLSPGADEIVGILVAEGGAPDLGGLVDRLGPSGIEFFGGLFPCVIWGTAKHERGAVAFTLPKLAPPIVVRDLGGARTDVGATARLLPTTPSERPTAIVLVDGLAPHTSRFLAATYQELGSRVSYWGGGAGSLSLEKRPCVFTRQGLFADAAIVALSSAGSTVGVRHGFRRLAGPLVVTRAEGNVIERMNWRPAVDVYRPPVEADARTEVTPDNFFRVTNAYPLGLQTEGDEVVVRDPVGILPNGNLVCVGDVPENAVVAILKGDCDSLVAAAGEAALAARPPDGVRTGGCLVADCVSRVMFLGDRFGEELTAIAARSTGPVMGMLTLGEIASRGGGFLELFNKTAVVASVHAGDHAS